MIGLIFILLGISVIEDGNLGGAVIVLIGVLWLWGYFVPREPSDPLQSPPRNSRIDP